MYYPVSAVRYTVRPSMGRVFYEFHGGEVEGGRPISSAPGIPLLDEVVALSLARGNKLGWSIGWGILGERHAFIFH